jgi:hypothetical protein
MQAGQLGRLDGLAARPTKGPNFFWKLLILVKS